jgi:uncharacterized protein (TIGR02147 family)
MQKVHNQKALSKKPAHIILYNYHDFKVFLQDIFEYLKRSTYRFSMRKIAVLMGYSTPNLFQQILNGKRKLNDDGILRIAQFLELNKNETYFFKNLVKMGQAEKHEEKDIFYRKLSKAPRYGVLNKNSKDTYRYYSHWYYPIIRELVTTTDFVPDPSWVARRVSPPITPSEADRALRDLVKIGQLRKTDNGFEQVSSISTTGEEVSSVAVTNFHKAMIVKAAESLDRFPHTKRNISSLTFASSQETYKAIVKEIFALQQKIIAMLENETFPSDVYQMNFQIFPCTIQSNKDEK